MKFAIVHFVLTNDVAVIPTSWIVLKNEAWWPPYKSSTRIMTAVMNAETVGSTWPKYQIRVIKEYG